MFAIWTDVPVVIKNRHDELEYGDIPVAVYNDITKQFMPVVNNRGYGYACRKRMKYRKKK